MGLDTRDLPDGVDDPPDQLSVADSHDTLPKSGLKIPDSRTDLVGLLESLEVNESEYTRRVQEASEEVLAAKERRNFLYDARQAIRQDIRVLRMRLRNTMPLEFPEDVKP